MQVTSYVTIYYRNASFFSLASVCYCNISLLVYLITILDHLVNGFKKVKCEDKECIRELSPPRIKNENGVKNVSHIFGD